MIPVPIGVRLWLAAIYTDVCQGMSGLTPHVQRALERDPRARDFYGLRDYRGDLVKVLFHDGFGRPRNYAAFKSLYQAV